MPPPPELVTAPEVAVTEGFPYLAHTDSLPNSILTHHGFVLSCRSSSLPLSQGKPQRFLESNPFPVGSMCLNTDLVLLTV